MRVARDRMKQAECICRGLALHKTNLVVFVDHRGGLDTCQPDSPRHLSLQSDPAFSSRILGVFGPAASPALLLEEARDVA